MNFTECPSIESCTMRRDVSIIYKLITTSHLTLYKLHNIYNWNFNQTIIQEKKLFYFFQFSFISPLLLTMHALSIYCVCWGDTISPQNCNELLPVQHCWIKYSTNRKRKNSTSFFHSLIYTVKISTCISLSQFHENALANIMRVNSTKKKKWAVEERTLFLQKKLYKICSLVDGSGCVTFV